VNVLGKHRRQAERGAALVIAIFTLMLISVVATAMILMADSETAMKGNYKSAMQAFYDAKAGLEEGRGRLWPSANNPNPIANCVFPPGAAMPTSRVCYILNPSPGETVDPTDQSATNLYADTEYQTEWGAPIPGGAGYNTVLSSSPLAGGIAGPLYKWVRITPRTEASSNIDVDGDGDHTDKNPLFYDGVQQLVSSGGAPNAAQVLAVTALAVTPYGSRRLVQYTVAPSAFASALATFPSGLTLDGNGVSFTGPSGGNGNGNSTFQINGIDNIISAGAPTGVSAIGYTNSNDSSDAGISAAAASNNYVSPAGVPNVGLVTLPSIFQTPIGLDSLVQSITQSADAVIDATAATADQSSLPAAMSAQNPMVIEVDGNFHLSHGSSGPFTGYGLLLVTGTLYYDPDASWDGIILVIGKGVFDGSQNGKGGQINGTVLVANTKDGSGNLLASLGPAYFKLTGGGNGIRYSSNLVAATQRLLPYQVLSFREITQTTP
jgi:hypothetical protein